MQESLKKLFAFSMWYIMFIMILNSKRCIFITFKRYATGKGDQHFFNISVYYLLMSLVMIIWKAIIIIRNHSLWMTFFVLLRLLVFLDGFVADTAVLNLFEIVLGNVVVESIRMMVDEEMVALERRLLPLAVDILQYMLVLHSKRISYNRNRIHRMSMIDRSNRTRRRSRRTIWWKQSLRKSFYLAYIGIVEW